MKNISFNCSSCGQSLEAPTEMQGETVECPACNAIITIPQLEDQDVAPPLKTVAPVHERKCPECGKTYDKATLICTDCGINLDTGKQLDSIYAAREKSIHRKKITAKASAVFLKTFVIFLILGAVCFLLSKWRLLLPDRNKNSASISAANKDPLATTWLKSLLSKEKQIINGIKQNKSQYTPKQKRSSKKLVLFEQRAIKKFGGIWEKDPTDTPKRVFDSGKRTWYKLKTEAASLKLGISVKKIRIYSPKEAKIYFQKQIKEPIWETREEIEERKRKDILPHERKCAFIEQLIKKKGLRKKEAEKIIAEWRNNDYTIMPLANTQRNKLKASINGGGGNGSCVVQLTNLTVRKDEADVSIHLDWEKNMRGINKKEITVVFLFQPVFVAKLSPLVLALKRKFIANFLKSGIFRIASGLNINPEKRTLDTSREKDKYTYGLISFCTYGDNAPNLLLSGKYTFTIKLKELSHDMNFDFVNKGILSVAVFKENDPKCDQLKSIKYIQVSNELRQAVDFMKKGQFSR